MIGNEILELLKNRDEVSLVNDILPRVFAEFAQQSLCPATLAMMQDYVTQLLYVCATSVLHLGLLWCVFLFLL